MELFNFLTLRLLSGRTSAEHKSGQNKWTSSFFFFFFLNPLAHANDITLFMDVPAGCTPSQIRSYLSPNLPKTRNLLILTNKTANMGDIKIYI